MLAQHFGRSGGGTVAAAALAVMVFFAGCGTKDPPGGDDKAGGSADPVVLRLANTSFSLDRHPALQYFVDRVKEVSGGALRIDVAEGWGNNAADSEQQVVRDVAAGTIQLGSVGTHVFDTVGVTAFQALTAPMLIDNYPLLQAVLSSDMPTKMLADLDKVGVDGVAVLGDGLRKPIAVAHPLLGPADYRGITFGAFRSQDHADAIKALGATPTDVHGSEFDRGLRSGDIDGFEKGLNIVAINESEYLAPYVTTNVNLWPHTLALIANPRTMSDLTETQRNWLTQAGADAASRSTDVTDDDADLVVKLCEAGARFADASVTDLQEMRQAFGPVYTTLNNDPTTKDFIDRIDELKQSTDPGPALQIPFGCTGRAAATPADVAVTTAATVAAVVSVLDGTYRWTITKDDALAHGLPSNKTPEALAFFPTIFTVTMNQGKWDFHYRDGAGDHDEPGGSYTVAGDQVVFNWNGDALRFAFTVDGDGALHLDPQPTMNPGDQFIWATEPWTKIADVAGSSNTEVADGTYRWTITKDDALAHGPANDNTPENLATYPWVFTMTMNNGTMHLTQRDGVGDHDGGGGTYTVDGDRLVFTWNNGSPTQSFTYTVDDDGTLHLVAVPPMAPGDQFVTVTEPWTKIG